MIELFVTSFPFLLRVAYLRWRGRRVTLYNVHRAVFAWLVLATAVFFAVFYYYPKSYTGAVPFRTVPIVAERGGTVTSVLVETGDRVAVGQLLFTIENSSEKAAVTLAEDRLKEVESEFAASEIDIEAAKANIARAEALLQQATDALADQQTLKDRGSTAFRENEYERRLTNRAARLADLDVAKSALHAAEVQLATVLPARRDSARAALEQAMVELAKTEVRSGVAGVVEQLTLTAGARAGQIAIAPVMVIHPDRSPDEPVRITAGFSQVSRSVLRVGMAAEVACDSNFNIAMENVVLPARIIRIQGAIASGQVPPTGRLIEPAELAKRGELGVTLKLVHPEHEALLLDGSGCIVQAYTTHVTGSLEGSVIAHVIETLGILKALLLRMKVWIALAAGIGLGGGGGH